MNAQLRSCSRAVLASMAALALAWAATPAAATVIAYEPFAGAAGELVGQNTGGIGFSGVWTGATGVDVIVNDNTGVTYTDTNGQALVQSGNCIHVLTAQQPDILSEQRNLIAALPDSGTYYVSGVFRAGLINSGDYFGAGLAGPGGKILLGQDSLRWACYNYDNDDGPGTGIGGNKTTFLVAKLVKGSNTAVTLWVNPILGDEAASGPGISATIANNVAWTGISTPVYSRATSDPGHYMADIRIGTTFADVTPAVPEPSTMALIFSALVGLTAYAWKKRG